MQNRQHSNHLSDKKEIPFVILGVWNLFSFSYPVFWQILLMT